MWIGLVQSTPALAGENRHALFNLIGTSERQVRRTYDVAVTSRALEALNAHVRQLVAEKQGKAEDIGDAAPEALVQLAQQAPPETPAVEQRGVKRLTLFGGVVRAGAPPSKSPATPKPKRPCEPRTSADFNKQTAIKDFRTWMALMRAERDALHNWKKLYEGGDDQEEEDE